MKIAYGNSRMEKKWKNNDISWDDFCRRVTPHPRQCVFFGAINSQNGYLRDITGNRRYWNVKVPGNGKRKPWELDEDTVKQIWAETVVYAKAGEKLYLPPELEDYAKEEQRAAYMLLESFDEDLSRLQRQVEELTRANEALQYENHGLRAKLVSTESIAS